MTRKKLIVIAISLILIAVIVAVALLVAKKPSTDPETPTGETPTGPEIPSENPPGGKEDKTVFTVTYDYCGGEGYIDGEAIYSTQVGLNKPFSLIKPMRTDTRFVFEGWFDLSGKQFTDGHGVGLHSWDTASDITLYAHWIEAFDFTLNSDGYTVNRGAEIDKLTNIAIPNNYNDLPVNAVGDFADTGIEKISLPQTITEITSRAFYNCSALTSLRWEQSCSLISIGAYAFYLSGIEDINIPESVTEIGTYAFSGSAVGSVTFKESNLTRIAESVFRDCGNLTEVVFEGGKIAAIGEYAFACSGVQKIVLPPLLTDIDSSSFSGCQLKSVTLSSAYSGSVDAFSGLPLEEIKVPIDNLYYSDIDGVLFDKSGTSLIMYPAGKRNDTYTIPALVAKIGRGVFNSNVHLKTINFAKDCAIDSIAENTFSECTSLSHITLPKSVKNIGARAFYNCTSLISVDLAEAICIGDEAFSGCSSIKEIIFPSGLCELGSSSFADCVELSEVIFDENSSLTSLNSYVFSGCKKMEVIDIPTSVTSIGFSAFSGCTSLKSIVIPTNVVSMGKNVFFGCEGLKSVTFDANSKLTTIESGTFSGCSSFMDISLPSGIKKIGWEAFKDCVSLKELTLPSLTSIGESAFEGCISLSAITVPYSIKTLPAYVFKNCLSLKKVTMDDDSKLTTIGDGAFDGCSSLVEVALPRSLTDIRKDAFNGCIKLDLIIPNNVINIEPNALMGVEKISVSPYNSYIYIDGGVLYGKTKDIITTMRYAVSKVDSKLQIPDSVVTIEANALSGVDLTEVVIPKSVTEMREGSFKNCINLTKVTFASQSGLTKISQSVFEGCSSLSDITIPTGVTIIESHAFLSCELSHLEFEHGNRLVRIGEGAFKNSGISKIDLPDSIQNIGESAFSGCDKLIAIALPEELTTIEANLLHGCVSLTQITILGNVTKIKSGAFGGCTSVANIIIPSSVATIESGAFNNWTYAQTINVQFSRDDLPLGWNDWNSGCNANIVYAQ